MLLHEQDNAKEIYPNINKYGLLINGEIIDSGTYEYFLNQEKLLLNTRETLQKLNKFKNGVIEKDINEYVHAIYSVSDGNICQKALKAAHKAFRAFRKTSIDTRIRILVDIREDLKYKKKEILKLMIAEGLPIAVAEWEFKEIISAFSDKTLNFYKKQLITRIENKEKNEIVLLYRKPDGVLGVFLPKNAPASSSFLALFALLVGNTIVIKPPYKMPISVLHVWQKIVNKIIVRHTNIQGVVNVIVGNSRDILNQWLDSPLLKDILYFGNSSSGLEIGANAFLKKKKVILELSGNDFLIVWDNQNLQKAAISFLDGFISSTQVCMLPRIALVHETVSKEFVSLLSDKIKDIKLGLPSNKETILSPVANIAGFKTFLKDALMQGAKLLRGGKRINHHGKEDPKGSYVEPTLIFINDMENIKHMRLYNNEAFFPLLTVVKISGNDEEIFYKICKLINENPFGLRTSLWINDIYYQQKFIESIDNSGMIRVNSRHIEFSEYLATHGGVGLTGGPYGELNYLWEKTSHLQGISIRS